MPLLYRRILDSQSINTTDPADLTLALDLGDYRQVHVLLTVLTPGEGTDAKLTVKHAPVNDSDAYRDFATPAEIDLTVPGDLWFSFDAFTQYVHWFTSGTLTADAVVRYDLVAKS